MERAKEFFVQVV